MWYVGDYLRAGDAAYSTRIGAFRIGQCGLGGAKASADKDGAPAG
jgi:hypothetical protein